MGIRPRSWEKQKTPQGRMTFPFGASEGGQNGRTPMQCFRRNYITDQAQKSRSAGGAAFPCFLTLLHCKEKRDGLPVIAQNYLLGNVTGHLSQKI